ncbi:hypothetical protein M0657_009847 [Pyricularia oryzae]|nr:hypothetical protein M0657_009847 [Pyricularia oryzae]
MDNHRSHQPLTEENLVKLKEQIPLLPRERLNKAKRRVHHLIRWLENQSRNVGILFAVRAQINNDDYGCRDYHYRDLVYKGEGNPDLEDPKFWEDQLRSLEKYKLAVRIKEAQRRVRDALAGIAKLDHEGLQILNDEEIYFVEGQGLLYRPKNGGPTPNLKSPSFWEAKAKHLTWLWSTFERAKHQPSQSPSPEPLYQPPPSTVSSGPLSEMLSWPAPGSSLPREVPRSRLWREPSSETSSSFLSETPPPYRAPYHKFVWKNRTDAFQAWIETSPESGMPSPPPLPSNHLSFYGEDFPLGSMIMIWQNPDLQKLVDAEKRNRAKWSVYHLLSGLQNHCGESGRKVVEEADEIYIDEQGAHRRGNRATPVPTDDIMEIIHPPDEMGFSRVQYDAMTPEQRQDIYRKKAKMPRDKWLLARKEAREKEIEMYKEDQRRREKEQTMIIDDLAYWEGKEAYLAEKYASLIGAERKPGDDDLPDAMPSRVSNRKRRHPDGDADQVNPRAATRRKLPQPNSTITPALSRPTARTSKLRERTTTLAASIMGSFYDEGVRKSARIARPPRNNALHDGSSARTRGTRK